MPGVLPPVKFGEHLLMDGGVVNNTPISNAIDAGATRIYVFPTGYACDLRRPPKSAVAMSLQAISLLVQQRLITDVHDLQGHVDLRVIPPVCPLDVSPADFSHGGELIELARAGASHWLDVDRPRTALRGSRVAPALTPTSGSRPGESGAAACAWMGEAMS